MEGRRILGLASHPTPHTLYSILHTSQVIGRVPYLTHLNGAEVRPAERRDAELRYLQVHR